MSGPYVQPLQHQGRVPRGLRPRTLRQDLPGTVLILLVGAACSVPGPPTWTRVMGGMLLVLGVTLVAAVVARHRRRPRPAPSLGEVDGVPATVIPRDRAVHTVGMVMVVELIAFLVGIGIAAALSRGWVLAPPLLATAVWWSVPVVHWLRGSYGAGGVWLTPVHLVHRHRGLRTTVAWDDVVGITFDAETGWVFVLVPDGRARHEWTRGGLHGPRAARRIEERIIRTEEMGLDAAQVAQVLSSYWHYPAQRSELGAPVSLTRVESLTRR